MSKNHNPYRTPDVTDVPVSPVFVSQFEEPIMVLERTLDSHFSGTLRDATRTGNAALFCLHVLTGRYDISEVSYRVDTVDRATE